MQSERLKALIKAKGYSQRSLAKAMGKSPNTLNNKVKGENVFWFAEVVEICRLLDITDPEEVLEIFLG